jgi:hypothetical protein
VDGSDTPHSLVANYIYELPFGRGKAIGSNMNKAANAVLSGWEVSQIATFKQGIPIGVSDADIASYCGNPRPDVVGDVHVAHPNIHEWFNTGAFAYAPHGAFGTAPRFFSYLRGPGYQNWDTSIMKNWYFSESMRLQFRAEMFNTFNHAQFYAPQFGRNLHRLRPKCGSRLPIQHGTYHERLSQQNRSICRKVLLVIAA